MAAETVARIVAGANPDHVELIVNGLAIDEYRRRGRETPTGLLDAVEPPDADLLPRVHDLTPETDEFRTGFDLALRALPEPERDAFILTDLRGLDQREAGDVLGTSQPTVHRRAEAARFYLAKELA